MNTFDEKNKGIIDDSTLQRIKQIRLLVVGAGGIGGHLANHLVRLGVKTIHLCDYDVFQASNLNRQLFSSLAVLGQRKVDVVARAISGIRPDVTIVSHPCSIEDIDSSIWEEIDIVLDAVDSIKTKLNLEDMAKKHNLPLVHGAVAGWYGQIGIIMPGSNVLHHFYKDSEYGLEKELGSPTFIPSVVAGMMVSELIKFLQGQDKALINKIMMVDALNHDYHTLAFNHLSSDKKKEQ